MYLLNANEMYVSEVQSYSKSVPSAPNQSEITTLLTGNYIHHFELIYIK